MHVSIAARIQQDLEEKIISGAWPPGVRVPYEHALMEQYGCSRMTVSKAMNELSGRGLIVRRGRAGSFVATPGVERSVLKIEDFADIAARDGQDYRHVLRKRRTRTLRSAEARRLGLSALARVVDIQCKHLLAGVEVAWEERLIFLGTVPQAEETDFEAVPPGTWLLAHIPWTEAEHVIGAIEASPQVAVELSIEAGQACLELHRRTWLRGALVTDVRLLYPGTRYRLSGRFSPNGSA